jgi:hypothetical protein
MFLDIVLRQFEILMNTPKAFAIPSPGSSIARTLGHHFKLR